MAALPPSPSSLQDVEGYIMLAKPKHFEPRPKYASKIGHHPVVVLTRPDDHGKVKVTPLSHNHPDNPPQQLTSVYNLPDDKINGEGTISLGKPKVIELMRLKIASPLVIMGHDEFAALLADIRVNYPNL